MTYKELIERHEKEIKELQSNCSHDDVSDWTETFWAVAHSSLKEIRYCLTCNKTIQERKMLDDWVHDQSER